MDSPKVLFSRYMCFICFYHRHHYYNSIGIRLLLHISHILSSQLERLEGDIKNCNDFHKVCLTFLNDSKVRWTFILFTSHSCTSYPLIPGDAVPLVSQELFWGRGHDGHGLGTSQSMGPKALLQEKYQEQTGFVLLIGFWHYLSSPWLCR